MEEEPQHQEQTRGDAARVSEQFELSRSRDDLSFQHTRQVTWLPAVEAEPLAGNAIAILGTACSHGMTCVRGTVNRLVGNGLAPHDP